jgi:hypothetical protein
MLEDKTRKVYPSLMEVKTSSFGRYNGIFICAQADVGYASTDLGELRPLRMLRPWLRMLTLGSGKSSRSSRPETKTALVSMRLESDFPGGLS